MISGPIPSPFATAIFIAVKIISFTHLLLNILTVVGSGDFFLLL
jgi:hypothetical protein